MKNQLYVKEQLVKCSICGQIATQDQYGNGECKNATIILRYRLS